ncbi:MAG: helix-turn-helix domain-containing protein [Gammaproteobacteria bacterium]|nr:helix-turn-helix domain-containing protein [Gammaproteobacteria bacterium]
MDERRQQRHDDVRMKLRDMLRREVRRSAASRYEHRLHGLLLMASGLGPTQVAELFGEDPRTLRRWANTLEDQGLPGLRDSSRPGRPPSLDAHKRTELRHDLDAPPSAFGLSGDTWNGKLLASHLRESYGTNLGVRQCQRLLRRIGTNPEH